MLQLHNLTIIRNKRHLMKDVSLTLSDKGCTHIAMDDEEGAASLARILSGVELPAMGSLHYQHYTLHNEKQDRDLAHYRQCYVKSIFGSFLIEEDKSVEENVTMGLDVSSELLDIVMNTWRLGNFRNRKAAVLDFARQARVILARISLQAPSMLVVMPNSTPYAAQELEQFYQLLQVAAKDMLVVVINAPAFERYANRVIAIKKGHILSDNQKMEEEAVEIARMPESFHIPTEKIKALNAASYHQDRWKYRSLALLFVMALLSLSVYLFTSRMDIVDMNMKLLEQEQSDLFAIQKKAQGSDGTVYDSQYETFQREDGDTLQKVLGDAILTAYYPLDTKFANSYLEGHYQESSYTKASYAAIIEVPETFDASMISLTGAMAANNDEAVVTLQDARKFVGIKGRDTADSYIKETFYWYGMRLTISGIVEETGLASLDTYGTWGNISQSRIFVKKGFVNQHPLSELRSFPVSEKRVLYDNKSYSFTLLYPVKSSDTYNYTNGSEIRIFTSPGEDEVLLNYDMALILGFSPDVNAEYEVQFAQYQQFVSQWVGKEIQVQTYTIASAPTNSMLFKQNLVISGFLFPQNQDFSATDYGVDNRTVYVADTLINSYLQKNIGISNMYYMNQNPDNMREALHAIQGYERYEAILPGDTPLQYLVRDLKGLNTFLLVASVLCVGVSLCLFLYMMHRSRERTKKQMSIYYTYGETRKHIVRIYMRFSARIIIKDLIIAWIASTFFMFLLTTAIVSRLYASSQIFIYLIMPLLFAICIVIVIQLCTYLIIHFQKLFYEPYNR